MKLQGILLRDYKTLKDANSTELRVTLETKSGVQPSMLNILMNIHQQCFVMCSLRSCISTLGFFLKIFMLGNVLKFLFKCLSPI